MTLPDDDLRSAFQHWRTQESEAVPGFPSRDPARSSRPQTAWLPGIPRALAWCGAALAILLLIGIPRPRGHQLTLAEALPRPLLAPPEDHWTFLEGFPEPGGAFSDFLQPAGSRLSRF